MPEKAERKWHQTQMNRPKVSDLSMCDLKKIYRVSKHKFFKSQGFTLIEMLLTLAIVALLSSLAVSRYVQLTAQQNVNRVAQQMRNHLELARTYAQTHQTSVLLCPVNGENVNNPIPICNQGTTWSAWMVAEVDDEGVVRHVFARSEPISSNIQITSGERKFIKINRQGGADGTNGTFTINNIEVRNTNKFVTLASNGRIRECVIAKLCVN